MGPEFEQGEWYDVESRHTYPESRKDTDIGLIKLKDQVKFNRTGKYYQNNLICLPDVNMTIEPLIQMALMSGWGKKDSWKRDDHKLPKIGAMNIELKNTGKDASLRHKFWSSQVYVDQRKGMSCTVGISYIVQCT